MSLHKRIQYHFMKDLGAPGLMRFSRTGKKRRPRKKNAFLGPPLECNSRLRELMATHYLLSRYAEGAKPVAWVTSGAPVEILRPFGFYTFYPENHGALCGAQKMGPELCAEAEEHGYHQDLCSYARIDLGHYFSGKTPVGRLPKPDLLFASNNICQTVVYWYKALAEYWKIPLILFDTPYNFGEISTVEISYMVRQLEEMIPLLEQISNRLSGRNQTLRVHGKGLQPGHPQQQPRSSAATHGAPDTGVSGGWPGDSLGEELQAILCGPV